MTLTGNQLLNHKQTFGLQQLQSAEDLLTPLFVLSVVASAGHLEARVAASELSQQFVHRSAGGCPEVGLERTLMRHTSPRLVIGRKLVECGGNLHGERESPVN